MRNCLIYSNYEIKLTNTAMASPNFQAHYSTIDGCRLPIRWMSPETISHVNKNAIPIELKFSHLFFFLE